MESNNSQQNRFQKSWNGGPKNQPLVRTSHSPKNTADQKGSPAPSSESAKNVAQNGERTGSKIKSFKELIVWQKGLVLVKQIYQATKSFPREEVYGIVSQMKRSAVSVPSNIAEGFRRRHAKEFKQFLNVGLGSLAELETQVLISGELAYLAADVKGALLEEIDRLTAMMISLSKKM